MDWKEARNRFRQSALLATLALGLQANAGLPYVRTDLVSDQPGLAAHTDPNLTNAWGLAFNPTGVSWVADNHSGFSTLYDGLGNPQSLVVGIPGGAPTGIVFNGSDNFGVSDGTNSGAARFIFAGEDGTISGWAPNVPPPMPSTQAQPAVNNSASGSIYKGLAINSTSSGDRIYATDFHNGRVDSFGGAFQPILPGAFADPTIPSGFAPFGIQQIGASVFVSYAMQDADAVDDVPGAGLGYVDEYDLSGALTRRFASQGALNAPWGMALAPAGFGPFSGALLVGNFGDGRINAFDRTTGSLLGALTDPSGQPIEIDGLWGLAFGNGINDQPTNTLFFTAGPGDEAHGLYGRVDVPEPACLAAAATLVLLLARRVRR
jgi:uncharacterized protein (TIGR03118 family)